MRSDIEARQQLFIRGGEVIARIRDAVVTWEGGIESERGQHAYQQFEKQLGPDYKKTLETCACSLNNEQLAQFIEGLHKTYLRTQREIKQSLIKAYSSPKKHTTSAIITDIRNCGNLMSWLSIQTFQKDCVDFRDKVIESSPTSYYHNRPYLYWKDHPRIITADIDPTPER